MKPITLIYISFLSLNILLPFFTSFEIFDLSKDTTFYIWGSLFLYGTVIWLLTTKPQSSVLPWLALLTMCSTGFHFIALVFLFPLLNGYEVATPYILILLIILELGTAILSARRAAFSIEKQKKQ